MDYNKLIAAVGDLDEETMIEILQQVMADGGSEAKLAMEACQKGMDIVGKLFEEKEYFLADLMFAGELMEQAVEVLKPALATDSGTGLGKVILCTVENDLHDIGKNIVRSMLDAAGFDVLDLGIDTPAERVVETAKAENVKIIALSGVLTLAITSMDKTIRALRESGLDVKIIIGGCPVNDAVCKEVGADAWAYNPQDTVNICRNWTKT